MTKPHSSAVANDFRPVQLEFPPLPPPTPGLSLGQLAAPAAFVVISGWAGAGKTYAAQGAARALLCSGHHIVILESLKAWLPTSPSFNWSSAHNGYSERQLGPEWEVADHAMHPLAYVEKALSQLHTKPQQQLPLLVLDHLCFFNSPAAEWLGEALELWRERQYPLWLIGQDMHLLSDVLAPHIAATPPRCRMHICFRQGPVPAGEAMDLFPLFAPRRSLLPVPLADLEEGQSVALVQSDSLVRVYLTERLVEPWQDRPTPDVPHPREASSVPQKRPWKLRQKKGAPDADTPDAGQPEA